MTITKINGAKKAVYRGICTTEASAQVKDVTISDAEWTLSEGSVIAVKFQYTNSYSATAANPCKLDVNDTGAKSIYYDDTDEVTGTNQFAFGYEDRVVYYMYDGTNWVFMSCSIITVRPPGRYFHTQVRRLRTDISCATAPLIPGRNTRNCSPS